MQAVQLREKYEQMMLNSCSAEVQQMQRHSNKIRKNQPCNKPVKVKDEPLVGYTSYYLTVVRKTYKFTAMVESSNGAKEQKVRVYERCKLNAARPYPVVSLDEFIDDYCTVQEIADFGPCKSFCRERLKGF